MASCLQGTSIVLIGLLVTLIFPTTAYTPPAPVPSKASTPGVCYSNPTAGGGLPNFPSSSSIQLIQTDFINWVGQISVPKLWMAMPRKQVDVVILVNWAYKNGYKLRASGFMHAWSPLTVTNEENSCTDKILLVNTTAYLNRMEMVKVKGEYLSYSGAPAAAVKVEPGTSMDSLLTYLEDHGLGLTNVPAQGDLTIGGVLAVGGHGTSLPALNEIKIEGHTYGSVSNLVISLKAVVWNPYKKFYEIQTFHRSNPETKALLVGLGRTFMTEVTLRVGKNYNLRCQSYLDISVDELFADSIKSHSKSNGRTFSSFLDAAGRVEAFWLPFTTNPWVKVWTVTPSKPATSRLVTSPYNYPFTDTIPETPIFKPVYDLLYALTSGKWSLAPTLSQILCVHGQMIISYMKLFLNSSIQQNGIGQWMF